MDMRQNYFFLKNYKKVFKILREMASKKNHDDYHVRQSKQAKQKHEK